jgi:hypothetical protein
MAKPARELPQFHSLPPAQGKWRRNNLDGTATTTATAKHLDLSQQRITQLVDENVLQRLPNGRFDLNDCRVRYIRWLRDPERRTAKSKVDSDFVKAKTELIAIRVREKQRALMETSEAMEMMEKMIGTVLTHMGGMAPRAARLVEGNASLLIRREVDRIVFDTRTDIANQFNEFARWAEETQPTTDDTEKGEAGNDG